MYPQSPIFFFGTIIHLNCQQIMHLVDVFRAKVIDISEDTVTIEVLSLTSPLLDVDICMHCPTAVHFSFLFQVYR